MNIFPCFLAISCVPLSEAGNLAPIFVYGTQRIYNFFK